MKSRNPKHIKGIDISNWQPNVNFKKVKDDGIRVVIMKATEGVNFIDKRLNEHYLGATKEGLKIGFYHFMSDTSNPREQAREFWNAIKNKKFDVIPVLDIESDSKGRNKAQITNRCIEFLNEFKALSGYNCIIYTYTYFAKDKLDNRLNKYPLWIAHYGVNTPSNNNIWNDWVGFQYSDKGKVNGVTGNCDVNEFIEEIFINKSNNGNSSNKKELWEVSINGVLISDLQKELNSQFGANLKTDGYFGEDTLKKCITLRRGAKGNITRIIQKRLKEIGYNLFIDGIFGNDTERAVKDLQKNRKLSIDGVVGKNTWKALFRK